MAQRTLAGQGPGAWPVCSRKAGLTRANGGASGAEAAPVQAVAKVTQAAPKAAPKVTVKATPKAAPKASTVKTTTKATTAPKRAAAAPVKATTSVGKRYHTVQAGDTLSELAASHGFSSWQQLFELNKDQIDNPDLIYVGQRFVLN